MQRYRLKLLSCAANILQSSASSSSWSCKSNISSSFSACAGDVKSTQKVQLISINGQRSSVIMHTLPFVQIMPRRCKRIFYGWQSPTAGYEFVLQCGLLFCCPLKGFAPRSFTRSQRDLSNIMTETLFHIKLGMRKMRLYNVLVLYLISQLSWQINSETFLRFSRMGDALLQR